MDFSTKFLAAIFYFVLLLHFGDSLECYVCTTQNGNTEKCLRTIRTCEPGEDYCLTTIAWGSHPYWTINADKQYYVSKQCATKSFCEKTWNETLPYCERIWYLDWRCSECCQGDRCNYFVTLTGSSLSSSLNLIFIGVLAIVAYKFIGRS
ncbi:uncharacterized protein LOC124192913 [Daphnia pulex]|uniref:uncharacterized protein LOC124192913 n=1 Tax=Daphnia pulex TaxID=6669 RepID=UPI001EDEBD29|nr:uncharacterized protein LOC124192913 [Daphnia pulex]